MTELTDEQIDAIVNSVTDANPTANCETWSRLISRAIIAADRAQRVPDADDILRVVCETDPADFNDKRNICISPEDLGDILRDALPSPTPTASKLHVWQAAKATCPAWHDAPTVPGIWLCDEGDICYTWTVNNIEILDKFDPVDGLRWYGPIQEDKP